MLEEWLKKDEDLRKADAEKIRQSFRATRDQRYARAWLLFNNFLEEADFNVKNKHSFSGPLPLVSAAP